MNLRTDQKKYRVFMEDGVNGNAADVWRYYELQGRKGKIWPYSPNQLCVLIGSNRTGERVRREQPTWKLVQNGDREMVFVLPDADLNQAAKIVRPKIRRVLSDETKNKQIARLKSFGFKNHTQVNAPLIDQSGGMTQKT